MGGKGTDAQQVQHVLWVNLAAGTLAGGAAAVITHPFDVVKTQAQVRTPLTSRDGFGLV